MSSSSSSAKPSSSSAPKPSSSSSSAAKPSSSSSSSAKPSSSSSSSGSSSSSSSAPKSASPQAMPTISANAWMSFFLFCCLVLIILQGPLGLTGGGTMPGVAQWAQWPNLGGGWWSGWGGMGGAPGCVGVVAGVVPWCQQAPAAPQPNFRIPQPQVQIQQVYSSPPAARYYAPQPRVINYQQTQGAQMGGQGGFATPEGGAGWSWFANGPSSRDVAKQYALGYPSQGQYYQPQQRSVQYQRPGLQLQVSTGPQQPQQPAYTYYSQPPPQPLPVAQNQYACTIYQPWYCAPIYAYAHEYPPHFLPPSHPQHPQYHYYQQQQQRAYAYRYQQPYYNPGGAYPNVIGGVYYGHGNGNAVDSPSPAHGYGMYQQQSGLNGQYQAQAQGDAPSPPAPAAPPMQPVQPVGPAPVGPNPYGGLANLENAFYPLLVGAIALLVIFDYAS
ncbi:hypothetical protein IAR50_000042 [Cryptococcus sp. DSM 104548]